MVINEKLVKTSNLNNSNLILQKLRNNIKNQSNSCDNKHNSLGVLNYNDVKNKHVEIKYFNYNNTNNELFKFKLTLNKSSQEYAKLNKENAKYKFLITSYSHMLVTLLKLRHGCNLDEIKTQLMKFKQLNYIFTNCTHFSSFLSNKVDISNNIVSDSKSNNKPITTNENEDKHDIQNEKSIIKGKIDCLDKSIECLKCNMKNYLINSHKENCYLDNDAIDSLEIVKDNFDKETSKNKATLDCEYDSNGFCKFTVNGNSHDYGEKSLNKTDVNVSKECDDVERNKRSNYKQKQTNELSLEHIRRNETVSCGDASIMFNSPTDYSPAPKYHSRSKTLSTKDEH